MNKQQARTTGLQNRKQLTPNQRQLASLHIYHQLLPYLDQHQIIGCYISMKEEVDTITIIQYCLANHKQIAVPVVKGKTLEFHLIDHNTIWKTTGFGVSEPVNGTPVSISKITLMIVPLSAYDKNNHRTGYGAGYYDSILTNDMYKVGIAYNVQEVDCIEIDEWDINMDEIITA